MPTRASTSKSQDPPVQEDGEPEIDAVEEEEEEEEEEEDESDVPDEEYEVDKVLDHRKGLPGKFNYLVSWKGYGPEHNTWEPQDNLEHATSLVSEYWAQQPKTDLGVKKRGRPSAGQTERATKVPRKSANGATRGRASKGKQPAEPGREEEEDDTLEFSTTHVDSIEKYQDVKDWEDLVKQVDTVERSSDNKLIVYVTMTGGEKVGLPAKVAYARCPQILLKFYEAHLKWRVGE